MRTMRSVPSSGGEHHNDAGVGKIWPGTVGRPRGGGSVSVIEIAEMAGIGDARERTPQAEGPAIPADTVVISAASHWLEAPDLWVERFPDHLKDRAPRLFFDGGWQMEIDGKLVFGPAEAAGFCTFECMPGINQAEARLLDLDTEG